MPRGGKRAPRREMATLKPAEIGSSELVLISPMRLEKFELEAELDTGALLSDHATYGEAVLGHHGERCIAGAVRERV